MRRLLVLGVVIVAAVIPTIVLAQTSETAAQLQGRWVVTSGEHGGKPMDSIKGGVMTITGNAFEIRTASGNMLKGTLRLDESTRVVSHAGSGR